MTKILPHALLRHLNIRVYFVIRLSSFVMRHFVLTVATLSILSCNTAPNSQNSTIDPNGPVEVVVPEHGAYTGAFMDFGDEEDDVTLEMIEDFEQMVGKHQAIIAS